jgi:hypothetical protein
MRNRSSYSSSSRRRGNSTSATSKGCRVGSSRRRDGTAADEADRRGSLLDGTQSVI